MNQNGRKRVGLAMGGGAVRGVAHLGVLEVLLREGIPIDYVSGTSAGSILAALYCGGMSLGDMFKYAPYVHWRRLAELTFSSQGFFKLDRLARWLVMLLGDIDITETNPPLAIVTMDTATGEPVVLREGSLARAVQASCAIPGLFVPVEWNGRFLSDGGLVDNLPVSAARELGADYVIGVDIFEPVYDRNFGPLGKAITSVEILVDRAGGGVTTADCLIVPNLAGQTYMRFSKFQAFYELGRRAAEERLPDIHRLIDKCHE